MQAAMPLKTSKPVPKCKAPTFKPPRPASKTTKSTKCTAPSRRKSAPVKSQRPSFIADEASASDAQGEDDDDDDDDDEMSEEPTAQNRDTSSEPESDSASPVVSSAQDPPPTVPPALLTKLIHHHFKDRRTRIGREANGVAGKYVETFIREAIARAAFERAECEREGAGDGTWGDWQRGFLEVEDLEKLAPQLILDF